MYDFFYSSYYYGSQEVAQGFDILDILTVWPPFEGPQITDVVFYAQVLYVTNILVDSDNVVRERIVEIL